MWNEKVFPKAAVGCADVTQTVDKKLFFFTFFSNNKKFLNKEQEKQGMSINCPWIWKLSDAGLMAKAVAELVAKKTFFYLRILGAVHKWRHPKMKFLEPPPYSVTQRQTPSP